MTRAERKWKRESIRLWKRWLCILGLAHPELLSGYEPGWVHKILKELDDG